VVWQTCGVLHFGGIRRLVNIVRASNSNFYQLLKARKFTAASCQNHYSFPLNSFPENLSKKSCLDDELNYVSFPHNSLLAIWNIAINAKQTRSTNMSRHSPEFLAWHVDFWISFCIRTHCANLHSESSYLFVKPEQFLLRWKKLLVYLHTSRQLRVPYMYMYVLLNPANFSIAMVCDIREFSFRFAWRNFLRKVIIYNSCAISYVWKLGGHWSESHQISARCTGMTAN